MKKSKHTPGKLEINLYGPTSNGDLAIGPIGYVDGIFRARESIKQGAQKANAEHLVRCWNSHDALLEACKASLTSMEDEGYDPNWVTKVEAAIEAATK
ncbi:MAG: hypothetical protein ACYSUX_00305 [Planctomycetota bacterium]|jgi:hypothetical protein